MGTVNSISLRLWIARLSEAGLTPRARFGLLSGEDQSNMATNPEPEKSTEQPARPDINISKKKQVLFTLVIMVIFLALFEVALRLLGLPRELRQDEGLQQAANNIIGYEYTPGWSGYRAGAFVTINSAGWRGKEFSPAKPEGTVRVVAVGDSYVFGKAVNDEDVFLAQLERMLNTEGGPRYETINTGHDGANTYEEFRYFEERKMMELNPDVVVLGFTVGNDAEVAYYNNRAILRNRLRDQSWLLDLTESSRFREVERNLRLARLVGQAANWIEKDKVTKYSYDLKLKSYSERFEAWQSCKGALIAFHEACRNRGVPLVVILFPDWTREENQTFKDYPDEFKRIHNQVAAVFSGRDGAVVVDIVDDLAATGLTTQELKIPIDGHPNRIWHELVARRLAETLREVTSKQ